MAGLIIGQAREKKTNRNEPTKFKNEGKIGPKILKSREYHPYFFVPQREKKYLGPTRSLIRPCLN